WVRCHRPGAGLVSTFPQTFNGGGTASDTVYSPGEGLRATIDPDDFSGGFGIWSGTSFAGPIFAAEIAAKLCATGLPPVDQAAAVIRTQAALDSCLGEIGP
ncbi:MAG: hypothetical protein QOD45_333, partial [Pseudonocardiales bacterium]|nr:hypothetical protein [Pseudonocardiales bacterium]